jgi:GT2 family glycosyltransferase
MNSAFVVGIVATFQRVPELHQLVNSLQEAGPELKALVVIDNSPERGAEAVVSMSHLATVYLHPGRNLGCGGGLHLGMKTALEKFGDRITHLLLLDDDAVLPANAITALIKRARAVGAEVVYPMIVNHEGRIGWFPGLLSPIPWNVIRQVDTPEEYWKKCGNTPVPFSWSPGVCLLISEDAVRTAGFPATDFWVRGEDLEYSLRLTSKFRSAFIPDVVVQHLLSQAISPGSSGELLKHLAMLQNIAYMATRLPHARRLLRTIPGNTFRFFRVNGYSLSHFGSLCAALWLGMFRGRPAGADGYNLFEKRYARLAFE